MSELLANRYELIGKVADGIVAAVWRGMARGEGGFARPVAVRILREPWDRDRAVLGAWAATASELAERASPAVEQAIDFVVAEGRAFVVTEWIEGISLRRWLSALARDHQPVAWPLATAIAIETLRGLASAHAGTPPLCHEGVDARSVRLARNGTVKLTRFGASSALAVRGTGRRKLEELGLRQPTPELVAGESSSPGSDVFAVGALLFEMLAVKPPFDAPLGEARDALVRAGEIPDLSAIRSDVPPLLIAQIERALRVDPSARFESAGAMIRALTQLLQSAVEPSGPEAVAAAVVAVLDKPKPEVRPQGLADLRTMHVDLAELTVLPRLGASAEPQDPVIETSKDESADEMSDSERRPRYRFGYKERRASLAAREERRLDPQESEAQPLPLTRRASDPGEPSAQEGAETAARPPELPKKPKGLVPQKTEFLDGDQVDRLMLPDMPKKPK